MYYNGLEKNIYWVNSEGRLIKGIATLNLEEGYISIENDRGRVFEILEAEQVKNGMSLQEIYNAIPFNITDFELGGRA